MPLLTHQKNLSAVIFSFFVYLYKLTFYELLNRFSFPVWVGRIIKKTRLKAAARTDDRVSLIQEILTSIRIIKMYVWEFFFAREVDELRK